MKTMKYKYLKFSHKTRRLICAISITALCIFCFFLSSCKKQIDYFKYVSELRNNIFIAQTEELSLRIFSVNKEHPYAADGIPKETSSRAEFYLTTPSGDKTCNITFNINNQSYGGEMSYDNVKAEYYYSCTLDISALSEIDCHIEYGDAISNLKALSVLNSNTLPPDNILNNLIHSEKTLFDSMTDKYGFSGEIYIRLIYEEAPYYYVGVINREGSIHAFLINAQSGKILARRQS